ncbi:MAG: LacI family DNA-binding transcriptional regulator [Candidatus Methylacidiphilales bacterium]|nr:LacI family DNA-binding transcriptional regulator [Candidatus Methylacidiphilales bacterium]
MKNPHERISQKDIATRAGVHITTVSLALRDSPRLPAETRTRIQALAREMGYRPDPMLTALTSYRQSTKLPIHQGTLGWIASDLQNLSTRNITLEYQPAVRDRCLELGYQLEEFHLSELSRPRLAKILKARNIQGLIFPPQGRHLTHINFDWESFSSVTFGFSLARPKLHLVTNAQYSSSRLAIRAMRKHGYRRIGYASIHSADVRTNQNFSSGFLAEQRGFRQSDQIPMLIYDETKPYGRKYYVQQFYQWLQTYKPEAILALDDDVFKAMDELKISYETCGVASLALKETATGRAGVCQNSSAIGRTAVDFLVGMMHRNERGVPAIPVQVLVSGTWVEGETLPRSVQPKAGSAS